MGTLYANLSLISSGGFGSVYRAYCVKNHQKTKSNSTHQHIEFSNRFLKYIKQKDFDYFINSHVPREARLEYALALSASTGSTPNPPIPSDSDYSIPRMKKIAESCISFLRSEKSSSLFISPTASELTIALSQPDEYTHGAKLNGSEKQVAIKQIPLSRFNGDIIAVREVCIHVAVSRIRGCVKLLDAFIHNDNIYLVFPFYPQNLYSIIQTQGALPLSTWKNVAFSLISALMDLKRNKIIHRDIKPSNILISFCGECYISDFGLSCAISSDRPLSPFTFSRAYRPPEILLGDRTYSYAADVWALGLCLLEAAIGKSPLLQEATDVLQLTRVWEFIGCPDGHNWPELTSLPDWGKISFPTLGHIPAQNTALAIHSMLPKYPKSISRILASMLSGNPSHRSVCDVLVRDKVFKQWPPMERLSIDASESVRSIAADTEICDDESEVELTNIKKKRERLFGSCVETVSKFFHSIYRRLTANIMSAMSGGSAQLSAIEGEDEHQMPDVELNVIHPHDSFRAISELSGGQQSIVGLAFLFALFSYKPAPFLILDEVDAALDAENVSKIGSFIEKHLTTQYHRYRICVTDLIVIQHHIY
ncbi:hypothetical protein ADUPG1_012894 [Aduncisulcus paluster]|uniref:Protein kinase domain-containing protein n=1 Tax=Aduncisulcus paluster TaxID=2918883 RepID=A0ABQ5K119_9EUKA|nr:hypothetical protein ADUPG1_012894 [Aduncisulcus paluster]